MKRTITLCVSFLLIAAVLVSVFSCDTTPVKQTGTVKETGKTTEPSSQTKEVTTAEKPYEPEPYDGVDGLTVNILTRDHNAAYSQYWAIMDLTASEILDEPINDAVYERNNYLAEKYGFTVNQVGTNASYADTIDMIRADIKSDTGAYDAVVTNAYYTAGTLAKEGAFVDLMSLETMDLDREFWNQRFIENMTVNNKLYAVVGDLSVSYWDVAWIQLFNKNLCTEKGIYEEVGDPYVFVNEGKWTLEVMSKMAALAAEDLNGDGRRDTYRDRYGYAFAPFNNYALFYAGGNSTVAKDENDLPVYSLYTTRAVDTVQKIKAMLSDKNTFTNNQSETNTQLFNTNRALFVNAQLIGVRVDQRPVEFDFGILPTPKIYEEQEEYTNIVSMSASVWSIPTSSQHIEETGFILNALAYKSGDTLYPAYFDTTFSIVSRDEESEKTLANILKGAYFDLSFMYEIGGWLSVLMNDMPNLDIASKNDALKGTSEKDIEDLIAAFQD